MKKIAVVAAAGLCVVTMILLTAFAPRPVCERETSGIMERACEICEARPDHHWHLGENECVEND